MGFLTVLFLFTVNQCHWFNGQVTAQTPLEIDRQLLDAMKKVESGGNACKKGDNGRSFGAYQIMQGYYNDAREYNPSLGDGGRTFKDVWGKGSEQYSEEVISNYMGRYATPQRLGREPTNEDIARIHNGGPNGYKSDSTLPYYNKVMRELARQQKSVRQAPSDGNQCNPACQNGQCCSSTGICNCLSSSLTIQPCSGTNSALGVLNNLSNIYLSSIFAIVLMVIM